MGKDLAVKDYIGLDDHVILFHLHKWQREQDQVLADLCKRFLHRRLLKAEEKGLMGSFHRVPVEAINRLQQQDAELLELVSTILYLTELGLEEEELYRKLQELKPRLFHRVDEAQEFISRLYYWKRERRDQ